MIRIIDIHSHHKSPSAIYNLKPGELPLPGQPSSVGVHPWYISETKIEDIISISTRPEVIAIGECGLDRNIAVPLNEQEEIFRFHISLSEELRKPLIIHCVRCFPELLKIHKEIMPSMSWIVHGYRNNIQIARQLLQAGIYYSLGEKFNEQVLQVTPQKNILPETDEYSDIYHIISRLDITEQQAADNIRRILMK